jgi:hypothetical protein
MVGIHGHSEEHHLPSRIEMIKAVESACLAPPPVTRGVGVCVWSREKSHTLSDNSTGRLHGRHTLVRTAIDLLALNNSTTPLTSTHSLVDKIGLSIYLLAHSLAHSLLFVFCFAHQLTLLTPCSSIPLARSDHLCFHATSHHHKPILTFNPARDAPHLHRASGRATVGCFSARWHAVQLGNDKQVLQR